MVWVWGGVGGGALPGGVTMACANTSCFKYSLRTTSTALVKARPVNG